MDSSESHFVTSMHIRRERNKRVSFFICLKSSEILVSRRVDGGYDGVHGFKFQVLLLHDERHGRLRPALNLHLSPLFPFPFRNVSFRKSISSSLHSNPIKIAEVVGETQIIIRINNNDVQATEPLDSKVGFPPTHIFRS